MTRGEFMKFTWGDAVRIKNSELKTYGMTGYISDKTYNRWIGDRSGSVYVDLENGKRIYYNFKNLEKVDANNMKENKKMTITGDFKVAKVKFLGGTNTNTEYEYAMFDDYEVGTTVVVASANHGLGVAKITAIIDKDNAITKKFEREVVCKVDVEPWVNRKKNRARLQELNSRMEKRAQEINKLAIFEMMAEKDESLKEMLAEYKELIG